MVEEPDSSHTKPSFRVFVRGLVVLYGLYLLPLLMQSISTIRHRSLKVVIEGLDWVWKVWVFLGGGTLLLMISIIYIWNRYSGGRIGGWGLLVLFFLIVFIPSAWVSLVGFLFYCQEG